MNKEEGHPSLFMGCYQCTKKQLCLEPRAMWRTYAVSGCVAYDHWSYRGSRRRHERERERERERDEEREREM